MMMQFNKNTKKGFGITNLTFMLVACYAVGYILEIINPNLLAYLTLDPYQIVKGQIWRIVTWLIIPPGSFDIFTLIMLYFYYRIGTMLEHIWGTAKYSRYILGGIGLTIVSSFLMLAYIKFVMGAAGEMLAYYSALAGIVAFSTYYINLSIFMGYAATFPDMMVLFFFVIPIKVKVLGIIDALLLVYMFFTGNVFQKFAIGAALINIGIFLLTNKVAVNPKQFIRKQQFNHEMKKAAHMQPAASRHKCAICGRTDETNPELEFRYCSKCNGNYEYWQDHLFTHVHVK